jgi:hypothetical protein
MPDAAPPANTTLEPLKFWLAGTKNSLLREAAQNWWRGVESALRWPLEQTDALTCTEGVLDLLAWQRDITRFKGEPADLYRKRVAYAAANAIDAGSTAGFVRIFERLGLGAVIVRQRNAGLDWDVVLLELSDSQIAQNTELLGFVVQQYGRCCRRYQIQVVSAMGIKAFVTEFSNDSQTFVAR